MIKEKLAGFKTRAFAVALGAGLLVGTGSSAFATVDPAAYDPTSLFTQVTTWLTGVLIPVVVGMLVLGITVKIGMKAVKRFAHKAI